MKYSRRRDFWIFVLLIVWIIYWCGCAQQLHRGEYGPKIDELPSVDVPRDLREHNFSGGSCVHASLVTLLRWQNRNEEARRWRNKFYGGEWATSVARKLDSQGIRYAYTIDGDVKFLEWACRTRRGCGVTVRGGAHMVTLVHFDSERAAVLDNNDISQYRWMPREDFLEEWQSSYGWAVTPIYSPLAPLPF